MEGKAVEQTKTVDFSMNPSSAKFQSRDYFSELGSYRFVVGEGVDITDS